jgi:hypothetical protein
LTFSQIASWLSAKDENVAGFCFAVQMLWIEPLPECGVGGIFRDQDFKYCG